MKNGATVHFESKGGTKERGAGRWNRRAAKLKREKRPWHRVVNKNVRRGFASVLWLT